MQETVCMHSFIPTGRSRLARPCQHTSILMSKIVVLLIGVGPRPVFFIKWFMGLAAMGRDRGHLAKVSERSPMSCRLAVWEAGMHAPFHFSRQGLAMSFTQPDGFQHIRY